MNYKLESRLLGEVQTTSDDTVLVADSEEKIKSLLRLKEESGKTGFKLKIQNTNIMASSPITSWQIDGEKVEPATDFLFFD